MLSFLRGLSAASLRLRVPEGAKKNVMGPLRGLAGPLIYSNRTLEGTLLWQPGTLCVMGAAISAWASFRSRAITGRSKPNDRVP